MIAALLTVGLLCLFYEAVLVGVVALAQRREDERREDERREDDSREVDSREEARRAHEPRDPERLGAAAVPLCRPAEAPPHPMRASDAERQRGADVVGAAMADGRLELDEGVERLDKVFRARYLHEVGALVSDLPSPPRTGRGAGSPPWRRTTGSRRSSSRSLVLAVVVTAFAVQLLTGAWALWPVAVAALLPFALWRRPR